ncbi:MAG: hypothetical protein H7249_07235 [Chitinophagaceae bacterium]|nr:hypothetical protein [Oligoflexus sp.]
MLKLRKWVVVGAVTFPLLTACGAPGGKATSSLKDDANKDAAKKNELKNESLFNLADYLKTSEYSPELKPYLRDNDLIFGDQDKISIRTNVKIEKTNITSLQPNGRNLKAEYFMNASVYPHGVKFPNGAVITRQKIVLPKSKFFPDGKTEINRFVDQDDVDEVKIKSNAESEIIDLYARAGYDINGTEVGLRLFSTDVYKNTQKAEFSDSFTRSVTISYPLMYGVVASANVGGEIGFTASAQERADKAITLVFIPKFAINSGVKLGAQILISELGTEGTVTLLETSLITSAAVKYIPEYDFAYGDISMDSAHLKAVDGKVTVYAKVGIEPLLPEIFQDVWHKISNGTLDKKWEHTVWDPKPVYTGSIPARGVFFTSNISKKTSEECTALRNRVYEALDIMEKDKNSKKDNEKDIAMSAQANLSKTALFIGSNCGK